MKSTGSALPELPLLGDETVSPPMCWSRWGVAEFGFDTAEGQLQLTSLFYNSALLTGPCPPLRVQGATMKVGVALFVGDFLNVPLNANHALEFYPMELKGRIRVASQL